ncbi:transcription initiation factor TFIID subunit 8 [Bradysia coprophila]|uniref:transcription initiation factor TFIID subunit 8 n=1 Tax=Bradysia coprophila TaxID=38358 RepID=UPI00187DACF3|nr:transcription initiation factor TFIID subunit 8 [Bradysia coprophila]
MEKAQDNQVIGNPRRLVLKQAVANILQEKGFETVEKQCIETLTEMIQSLITEIGQSSRNYCELSGRTQPVIGDVVVALINAGISIQGLETFAKRESRVILQPPQQISATKQLNLLQAGTKNSHPTHIPNHLPVLPDPHAYIRTPTHKQPVTEYEAIREKAANQKKDVERALTRFLAKTSETHSLFDVEDNQMFPLIACKPAFPTYLQALNPTDQVFDFEELEYHYQVANRTEDAPSKDAGDDDDDDGDEMKESKSEEKMDDTVSTEMIGAVTAANNSPTIDNPYLRAAKIPK